MRTIEVLSLKLIEKFLNQLQSKILYLSPFILHNKSLVLLNGVYVPSYNHVKKRVNDFMVLYQNYFIQLNIVDRKLIPSMMNFITYEKLLFFAINFIDLFSVFI
jgi:hypothetical protein